MAYKKGKSEKKTDWLGNKYIQHYDSKGNKSGKSVSREGFFGNKYTQHYGSKGEKKGRSEKKEGFFGNKYTQKYNSTGDKSGTSEKKEGFFGNKYTQHYDDKGNKTDRSIRKEGFWGNRYVERYSDNPEASSHETASNGPDRRYSGGGGGYSGSSSSSSSSGIGKVLLIIIGLGIVLTIASLSQKTNNSTQQYSPASQAPVVSAYVPSENYSGYPSAGRYPQNTTPVIKEYFQNKLQFSIKSADVVNDRIIVNFEIKTLTNANYFFLVNKANISDSVNSTEKPYIVDSKGNKFEMIGGPMGDILQNADRNTERQFGIQDTYWFKLRPLETVTGRMEFPIISEGTRKFSLVIPQSDGHQSEIKIDNIQLVQGDFLSSDEQKAASEQTWEAHKSNAEPIRIAQAFICRSMTYGSPSGAVTSVSEESLREWTGRGQLIYFIAYENAIPNDTRVHFQWFREGTPIGNPCDKLLQSSSGTSFCILEYPFTAGNYEARLSVGDSEVNRQSCTVLLP